MATEEATAQKSTFQMVQLQVGMKPWKKNDLRYSCLKSPSLAPCKYRRAARLSKSASEYITCVFLSPSKLLKAFFRRGNE